LALALVVALALPAIVVTRYHGVGVLTQSLYDVSLKHLSYEPSKKKEKISQYSFNKKIIFN